MAYVIGLLTNKEIIKLKKRGWELEEPPFELNHPSYPDNKIMKMIWVDCDLFEVMNDLERIE